MKKGGESYSLHSDVRGPSKHEMSVDLNSVRAASGSASELHHPLVQGAANAGIMSGATV